MMSTDFTHFATYFCTFLQGILPKKPTTVASGFLCSNYTTKRAILQPNGNFSTVFRKIVASGNCKKFVKTLHKQRKNSRLVDGENTACVWQISHQQKGKKMQNEFLTKFFAICHQKKKSNELCKQKLQWVLTKTASWYTM